MLRKLGRWGVTALMAVSLIAIVWLAISYTDYTDYTKVVMAKEIGIQEPSLPKYEYSAVPKSVLEDATALAREMVGRSRGKLQKFIDQLVATYMEARDMDVVIVFNSGGWGWNLTMETPGWASILDGIKSELENLGYKSLVLNYRRTTGGVWGCIKEFIEAVARYPHKARDLAKRVEFLTDHIPDLKVIVTGESTGTVISDKAMVILNDKPQVYSIQTGTPFWHKPTALDRTLLMNSNGRGIDTFSYGNVPAMVWATFKSWFGLASPEENPGNILSWLRAPGHDYSWQYPGVYSEVVKFLTHNFGWKK
jgi:hypothetical protein